MRAFPIVIGLLIPAWVIEAQAAPTVKVIYNVNVPKGAEPAASLIADSSGNLYTTTGGGDGSYGTVIKLAPPGPGKTKWVETTLYTFNGGKYGGGPPSSLLADSKGDLYTTTNFGGGSCEGGQAGTVTELIPPAPGGKKWTPVLIHSFGCGSDGYDPFANLIADASGNLYTTTYQGGTGQSGTIVELTPQAAGESGWTETVLYSFKSERDGEYPTAGLLADSAGNLYTTTSGGGTSGWGTVVELSPPVAGQTKWTETILYSFKGGSDGGAPVAGLIADSAGNLYTTTQGGGTHSEGTIVKLTRPQAGQTGWTEAVLYSFAGKPDGSAPAASLIADAAGNLYTTTFEGGTSNVGAIVEVTPPSGGQSSWTESVLHSFVQDGSFPTGGLISDAAGNLYTTAAQGGRYDLGTVVELSGAGFVVP